MASSKSEEWNFSLLPEGEHQRAINAYRTADTVELIVIHDQYLLSKHTYCCGSQAPQQVYDWFGWAIENGLIHEQQGEPLS